MLYLQFYSKHFDVNNCDLFKTTKFIDLFAQKREKETETFCEHGKFSHILNVAFLSSTLRCKYSKLVAGVEWTT